MASPRHLTRPNGVPVQSQPRTNAMSLRLFALLCFFLSGTTGLVYQVIWTRFMGHIIGNTHFSITMVVAVFMGGLAIGSYLGGRLADRTARPLRLYGLITVGAGIACLLVPLLTHAGRPMFAWLYQFYEGEPQATPLLTARLAFCSLLLLVPTTFMGATLPALSRYFTRQLDSVGSTLGLLYTLNTLGAVVGVATTGFFAIPHLGLWGCTILGVAIDLALGCLILLVARRESPLPVELPGSQTAAQQRGAHLTPDIRIAIFAFGLSGFVNMLLQIAWTKAIVLTIGNSTYAFSLIVTLFILGIAIGGGAVSLFIDRVQQPLRLLGAIIFTTGALVSMTIPFLGHFPILGARAFDKVVTPDYSTFLGIQVFWLSAVILPCTVAMGMVFPVVGRIRTRAVEEVGSAVGSAYFWNTFGSILGTLVSGFVLIPLLGKVFYTLYIGAGLSIALGAFVIFHSLEKSLARRVAVVGGLVVAIVAINFPLRPFRVLGAEQHYWDPAIMARGAYAYFKGAYYRSDGSVLATPDLVAGLRKSNEVLLYQEGVHAPVAIVRNPTTGETAMRISGKVEASIAKDGDDNADLPHQIMAGHLPMLLHSNPRRVATLGLGGGVTLGTLTLYPEPETIDSLEISPEVVEAARVFFAKSNHDAIANPKVRNIIGDGRNHLGYTPATFDVITSVPSNPWIAGIGNLFTVEFFETCRDKLNEGGILCNWIHKINMRKEDFRTVLRTFVAVFGDHAQLWDLGLDCMLIGSNGPVKFDAARLESMMQNPLIQKDLKALGIIDIPTFLKQFRLNADKLRAFVGEGPTNTDNFPVLEFSCPYGLYGHDFDAYRDLTTIGRSPLDRTWLNGVSDDDVARANALQETFLRYQVAREAEYRLRQDVERMRRQKKNPATEDLFRRAQEQIGAITSVAESLRAINDPWLESRANQLAAAMFGVQPAPTLRATLARFFVSTAATQGMRADLRTNFFNLAGSYVSGSDLSVVLRYGRLALELGKQAEAIPAVEAIAKSSPNDAQLSELLGILYAASHRPNEGIRLFNHALTLTSNRQLRSQIYENRGFTQERLGQHQEALKDYRAALEENPESKNAHARIQALQQRLQAN